MGFSIEVLQKLKTEPPCGQAHDFWVYTQQNQMCLSAKISEHCVY